MHRFGTILTKSLQCVLRAYAYVVSPFLGRNCRFYPTCSSYAHEALERHGAAKGIVLAIKRILKCHPWSRQAWNDPVPLRIAWKELLGYKRASPDCSLDREAQKK